MAAPDREIRPNAVYTIREVCQILQVSDATLRRWIKDGKIKSARIGRAYRFLGSQILEALTRPTVAREIEAEAPRRRGRPARS